MMRTGTRNVQQISAATIVLVVAAIVTWMSYTREPASAFLFPRVISIVFFVLACWNFARAAMGLARVGDGLDMIGATNIAPGLAIMAIYIFWLAKFLGFYVASSLTFYVLLTVYYQGNHRQLAGWTKRALITILFMAIMYGLFALVLKVQLPRGLFI